MKVDRVLLGTSIVVHGPRGSTACSRSDGRLTSPVTVADVVGRRDRLVSLSVALTSRVTGLVLWHYHETFAEPVRSEDHPLRLDGLAPPLGRQLVAPDGADSPIVRMLEVEYDTGSGEVVQAHGELLTLPDAVLPQVLEYLAATQHDGTVALASLSGRRFLDVLADPVRRQPPGFRAAVVGCGLAGEVVVLHDLGAAEVIGYDTSSDVLAVNRARFADLGSIGFTTTLDGLHGSFDLVDSHHVLEHVPRPERGTALEQWCSLLRPGGMFVLDVPNERHPVEAHTGVAFFHLLGAEHRREVVQYLAKRRRADDGLPDQPLLEALVDHENVGVDELRSLVPRACTIESIDFVDLTVPDMAGDPLAPEIRAILRRRADA